ncbi:cytochrome P450 6k1-like [Lasioglossum baleicum]|uniref:cytochrome P450 6k1-like n=1 Tax=Lasioglossum baleicum TaxID=434251 RepID=UPI003FCE30B3
MEGIIRYIHLSIQLSCNRWKFSNLSLAVKYSARGGFIGTSAYFLVTSGFSKMAFVTSHWILDGILILASLIVAAYIYMTRQFKYWIKKGVAEISPMPFLGNFADCVLLKKAPAQLLSDFYEQSKGLRYVGFYVFDRPCLLIRDPEIVKHVLAKDFNVFCNRNAHPAKIDRIEYTNIFAVRDAAWKILRSRLSPMGTSMKLKRLFDLMIMVAEDLDKYLEGLNLTNGKVMEMKNLCACLHTDMVGNTIFGLRVNSLQNENAPFRLFGKKMFSFTTLRSIRYLIIYFIPQLVKITGARFSDTESCNYFRSIFWGTVDRRVKSGEERSDFLGYLMELKEQYKDEGDICGLNFTGDDLVAQAVGAYVAGFETGSSVTAFTLYELAMNLDVQEKLRTEILNALEETNGKMTYEMIQTLPYLDMVVAETLRMYPPLGFLDRLPTKDYKIPNSDLVLKKDTPVYIPVAALHHDPEYFPNPEKFDPMRFSKQNEHKIRPFTYMPFGEGPRICIALRWGLQQVKVGLVQLLRKYEVTPCEQTPVPIVIDTKALTTAAKGGLYLNVRKVETVAG